MSNKFGFISHFLSGHIEPNGNRNSTWGRLAKRVLPYVPPFPYLKFSPILSENGERAEGIGVACPLLAEHFVSLEHKRVLGKLQRAAEIAERWGARIVGLGGFTSVFGNEGEEIAQRLRVPVTSGNTYTAVLAVEGIEAATRRINRNLADMNLAVIGATGDIGSACARTLSTKVAKITLAARRERNLQEFAQQLVDNGSTRVEITRYTKDAVRNAEIVLCAASAITTLIEAEDLKPGTIVCDVGYPANVARDIIQKRNDIFIFEGGLATWTHYFDIKDKKRLHQFSPRGTVHGCLAETMILALSGRYTAFSFGRGKITEGRMREMQSLARLHGFSLAPFHYAGQLVSWAAAN